MTEEQHIQRGFNAGYQLQKHDPELAQTIQKGFNEKEHPYAEGFGAGCNEFIKEKSQMKVNNSLFPEDMNNRESDNNFSNEQEMDIDLDDR